MNEFLSRTLAFLDAVRTKGADAADKGADALHQLADFLRSVGQGVVFAASPAALDDCIDRCKVCLAAGAPTPGVVGVAGPGLLLVLQIILTVLERLRKEVPAA